jgi:hypothetical protein
MLSYLSALYHTVCLSMLEDQSSTYKVVTGQRIAVLSCQRLSYIDFVLAPLRYWKFNLRIFLDQVQNHQPQGRTSGTGYLNDADAI